MESFCLYVQFDEAVTAMQKHGWVKRVFSNADSLCLQDIENAFWNESLIAFIRQGKSEGFVMASSYTERCGEGGHIFYALRITLDSFYKIIIV